MTSGMNFSANEERWLRAQGTPERIQRVLDSLPYRCEDGHLPAIAALRDWKAHCFDGALLAAAALRRRGYQPYIIDLCAVRDDDHLLCAFRSRGFWGAVAKSNFPGLRFREPIFRTVHELVLSYFEFYFNLKGEKSLRSYSRPVKLPSIARLDWECDYDAPSTFLKNLAQAVHMPILKKGQSRVLAPIDERLFQSQMLGVNLKGAHGGSSFSRIVQREKIRRPRIEPLRAKK